MLDYELSSCVGPIRRALFRQLQAVSDGEATVLTFRRRDDATSTLIATAVPGPALAEVDIVLGTIAGNAQRLTRLGFEPNTSDSRSMVYSAPVRSVGDPTAIARRIAAVLRYVHSRAPTSASITIERSRPTDLIGGRANMDQQPIRSS